MFFHTFPLVTCYGVVVLSSKINCGFPWDGFCLAHIHSWVLTRFTHDDPLSTFKDSIFLTKNAKYEIQSSDYNVNQFISPQPLCFNHRGVKSKVLKAHLQQQQQQRSTKWKTFCTLILSLWLPMGFHCIRRQGSFCATLQKIKHLS